MLQQTIGAWRVIFFVTIALYVVEIVAYLLMASGEEQPWNKGDKPASSIEAAEAEATPLNTKESKQSYNGQDQ